MKTIVLTRWIALIATDTIVVVVPEDFDLDVDDPESYQIICESRVVRDSTDCGPWEEQQ